MAIISFFPTSGDGAVGSLDWPVKEREIAAAKSKKWCCAVCSAKMDSVLPDESQVPLQTYEVDPEIVIAVKEDKESKGCNDSSIDKTKESSDVTRNGSSNGTRNESNSTRQYVNANQSPLMRQIDMALMCILILIIGVIANKVLTK